MIQSLNKTLLALWIGSFLLTSAVFGAEKFDVSYLWHSNAGAVLDYRKRVVKVLGPALQNDFKVVVNDRLYGLIYNRQGDRDGAVKVAQSHSRILQAKGMEKAAPVISHHWNVISLESEPKTKTVIKNIQESPDSAKTTISETTKTGSQQTQKLLNLELAVEDYIKELRKKGKLANDERTGWSVYDFTTGEKLVTINEDVQFQAASLVKPFIALAFFHQVKKGKLIYGPKSRRHMERMIHRSNNPSTNWIMRQVGGPAAVERVLKRHYPNIFKDTRVVEYIPAGGRTYRNKASAHDYSRFLHALWKGEIPRAKEITRLMALPGIDRILTDVEAIPQGTEVFNKTGSTGRLCGDMGILIVESQDGKRYPYTLIGIIEKRVAAKNYTAWIRSRSDVIRNVSNIVYKGIAQQHDLEEVL